MLVLFPTTSRPPNSIYLCLAVWPHSVWRAVGCLISGFSTLTVRQVCNGWNPRDWSFVRTFDTMSALAPLSFRYAGIVTRIVEGNACVDALDGYFFAFCSTRDRRIYAPTQLGHYQPSERVASRGEWIPYQHFGYWVRLLISCLCAT
jgi:hypothetical protein